MTLQGPTALQVLLLGLLKLGLSYAQATPATCTATGFDWAYNSLKQSPCDVGAYLGGVCNGGQFTLPALTQVGQFYQGPTVETVNPCRCSTVYYSLLSACGACQSRNFLRWSSYAFNCTTVYPSVFPEDIPTGTHVPSWAYLDVVKSDGFNITVAQAAESTNSAESTATPKATGTTTPSALASPTPSSSPDSTGSKSKSKTGAIVGGVIGGLAFVAFVVGLVWWFLFRQRKDRHDRNATHLDDSFDVNTSHLPPLPQSPNNSNFTRVGSPLSTTTSENQTQMVQKLYNPSDPSTFPSAMPMPIATASPNRMVSPPPASLNSYHPGDSSSINYSTVGHHGDVFSTQARNTNGHYGGAAEV